MHNIKKLDKPLQRLIEVFLASRLRSRGYRITSEAVAVDETVPASGKVAEAPSDFDSMNIAQLKEFAEEKGIDLGSAKLKADIIAAIIAAIPTADVPEPESE